MSIIGIMAGAGLKLATPVARKLGEAIVDKVAENVVAERVGNALDKTISAVFAAWKQGHGQSLVSASASVRVEPYVLVDARATRLPYTKDAMMLAQKLYSSYYLLANAAENTIAGAKISKRLDKFATDRDLRSATTHFLGMEAKAPEYLSLESYQFGLPFVGEAAGLNRWADYSTEANDPTKGAKPEGNKNGDGASFKTNNVITDVQNLAVGQMLDVTITDGNQSGTIPVMVRMRPLGMDPHALSEIIALGGESDKIGPRWQKFRLGDIPSFMDLVTKQDQVRRYRQALYADKSGYFRKALARSNKALLATAMTGTPSIGDAVSIAIVTRQTLLEAEEKMDGPISDFEVRQNVFDRGMMMMMIVLDEDAEVVTIYTRDIDDVAKYTLRDLKSSASSNNNDLADIMKNYLEGRVPGRI
jgi:hypothetical protein